MQSVHASLGRNCHLSTQSMRFIYAPPDNLAVEGMVPRGPNARKGSCSGSLESSERVPIRMR